MFNHSKGTYGAGKTTKVVSFTAGGVITAGDHVKMDVSQTDEARALYVVQGGADGLMVGVAITSAAAAGDPVDVAVGGYVEGAKTDGNVTSGISLSAGATGALIPNTELLFSRIVGVALETDSGTLCDVYLFEA